MIEKALVATPGLIDDVERAFASLVSARLDPLAGLAQTPKAGQRSRWRAAWTFARYFVKPIRGAPNVALGTLGDVVAAFSPTTFVISGFALAACVLLTLSVPVVTLVRLVIG
jgi:hypothetical protein